MKLNRNKKVFLKVVLNFLIADYMSWKLLGNFIFNQQKSSGWLKNIRINFIKEKEAKFLRIRKEKKDDA